MKGFLHIFDLTNRKYFSVFQGFCAVIVKVTDFDQVINFCKRAHGAIPPNKLDKNNRTCFQK